MAYKRINLPYKYDALEPFIDKETMEIHYEKHHKGYETKLNNSLEGTDIEIKYPTLISLVSNYQNVDNEQAKFAIREAGGGLINHNFFWDNLKKDVVFKDSELKEEISITWGSLENFKESFKKEVLGLFGSGWVWLVRRKSGGLKIIRTFNQDNPWYLGFDPIIAIDVWEHAYYLKHNSARVEYFEDYWNVVNWDFAVEQYTKSISKNN